jgi:transposase
MSREVHVRFCERAGVRFPRATRPTLPVLDPGRGRTKTGRLWGYAVDDRSWGGSTPPAVVYLYAEDRKGERPAAHLAEFTGILQVDGYSGFERLLEDRRKRRLSITAFRHRRQPRAARPASSRAATVRARGSWSGPRPRARARR